MSISFLLLFFWIYAQYRENNKELTEGEYVTSFKVSTGNKLSGNTIISGELDSEWPETIYSAGYVINEDTMYLLLYKTKGLISNKKFEINVVNDKNKIEDVNKIVVSYTDLKGKNGFSENDFSTFKNKLFWKKK